MGESCGVSDGTVRGGAAVIMERAGRGAPTDSRDLEGARGKGGGLKQGVVGGEAEKGLRGQESPT